MVPSVVCDCSMQLPLTPNGKVDRKALPEPEGSRRKRGDYVARADAKWKRWCAGSGQKCWEWSRWACYDNFFELGGHSLLATQVISRVREAFARGVAAACHCSRSRP